MANYTTNLKDWGSTGQEFPDSYNYLEGEQPVDAWDNFLTHNLIADVKDHLIPLTNSRIESDYGTATPPSPEDGHLFYDQDDAERRLFRYRADTDAWEDLAMGKDLRAHESRTDNPHAVGLEQARLQDNTFNGQVNLNNHRLNGVDDVLLYDKDGDGNKWVLDSGSTNGEFILRLNSVHALTADTSKNIDIPNGALTTSGDVNVGSDIDIGDGLIKGSHGTYLDFGGASGHLDLHVGMRVEDHIHWEHDRGAYFGGTHNFSIRYGSTGDELLIQDEENNNRVMSVKKGSPATLDYGLSVNDKELKDVGSLTFTANGSGGQFLDMNGNSVVLYRNEGRLDLGSHGEDGREVASADALSYTSGDETVVSGRNGVQVWYYDGTNGVHEQVLDANGSGVNVTNTTLSEQGNRVATRVWTNNNAYVPNAEYADNADLLDGLDSTDYIQADGSVPMRAHLDLNDHNINNLDTLNADWAFPRYSADTHDDVSPEMANGMAQERVVLYGGTVEYATAHETTIYLNDEPVVSTTGPERGTFDTNPGDIISAEDPVSLHNASGDHQVAPLSWADTEFVYDAYRDAPHHYTVYAPESPAEVELHEGSITDTPDHTVTVGVGETATITGTSTYTGYVRIVSSAPVVVHARSDSGRDHITLSPPSREVIHTLPEQLISVYETDSIYQNEPYHSSEGRFITQQTADGSGTDAEQGVPYKMLGDTYVLGHDIADYAIGAVEPVEVTVYEWDSTNSTWAVLDTHDLTGASRSTPQEVEVGDQAGNGTTLSSNAPFMFVGSGPFYLRTNRNNSEYSAIGLRQRSQRHDAVTGPYLSKNGGTLYGDLSFDSNLDIHLSNGNINGINALSFNDAGQDGRLDWSNWSVFDAPNDFSNTSGNLQIRNDTNGNRALTVTTNDNLEVPNGVITQQGDRVATRPWATGQLVDESGDTMSGTLRVAIPDAGNPIEMEDTSTGDIFAWRFTSSGQLTLDITDSSAGTHRYPFHVDPSNGIVDFNNTPEKDGNTIWHAGNDGSGSGLDADLLDGVQLANISWADTAMATSDVSVSDLGAADASLNMNGHDVNNVGTLDVDGDMNFTGGRFDAHGGAHLGGFVVGYSGVLEKDSLTPANDFFVHADRRGTVEQISGPAPDNNGVAEPFDNNIGWSRVEWLDKDSTTDPITIEVRDIGHEFLRTVWMRFQSGTPDYIHIEVYDPNNAVWNTFAEVTGNSDQDLTFENSQEKFSKVRITLDNKNQTGDIGFTKFAGTTEDDDIGRAWASVTGDTMHGNLNFASGAPQVNGNDVWHPGNDGNGSGLDADLLDGKHASELGSGISEDGTEIYSAVTDINFTTDAVNVVDDGDGTVTIDTSHNHDGRYLNLSGNETVTGEINMSDGTWLTANSAGSTAHEGGLRLSQEAPQDFRFTATGTGGTTGGAMYISHWNDTDRHTLMKFDERNYINFNVEPRWNGNTLATRNWAMPQSGGTMTGQLTMDIGSGGIDLNGESVVNVDQIHGYPDNFEIKAANNSNSLITLKKDAGQDILRAHQDGLVEAPNGDVDVKNNGVVVGNFRVSENSNTNSLEFNFQG